MGSYKEDNGTWKVKYSYNDETGKRKYVTKRGFKTKREADAWETEQKKKADLKSEMTFESFAEIYTEDHLSRLRSSTAYIKEIIIRKQLLPFFGKMMLSDISVNDVIEFQNSFFNNESKGDYSESYISSIHSVLNAMFGFAVKHCGIKVNPAKQAGGMGSLENRSNKFWSLSQYRNFISNIEPGTDLYYIFEILYWTGIRVGELMALTPADFCFDNNTVMISATYCSQKGEGVVQLPKTENSFRVITIPPSLSEELKGYVLAKGIGMSERIFKLSKNVIRKRMDDVAAISGNERIRIHDLRHSHASLIIKLGFSFPAVAERLGHSGEYISHRYTHMWPGMQKRIAKKLDELY